ncbi:MAG TPA: type II toxin-antitoxin system PemK/MazF family toxin [Verrucomicrobiae bacterium]|nr:type II toxin-antitoxin system PemK/MazF family toxin [Verrucomicrobiae bacterium]
MKRGEVYWADLLPRSGSEQTGRRPVVIISHDGFNQTPGWKSIIVVPISTSASQGRRGPTVVEIPAGNAGLAKTSFAVCHQVTTLDRAKLTKRIGILTPEALEDVEAGVKAALDLD